MAALHSTPRPLSWRGPLACVAFASAFVAIGCTSQPAAAPAAPTSRQEHRQQARALAEHEATAREELEQIPPPSKRRYLQVHTADGWANPFLRAHADSVTLRVIFPQQTGSALDGGSSLLHPSAARRQELEVRLADLPEALGAIPEYAWPYGRVVAIQEAPAAARQDRAQVRRTVETTLQILGDLGVVADEWTAESNTPNGLP